MSEQQPTTAEVAASYTALWRAGNYAAPRDSYWADAVVNIEPDATSDDNDAVCRGIEAVRARNLRLISTHGIEGLSLDGPLVTGDHFALFADMLIVHAGQRRPHRQIAVFADGL